MEGQFFPRRARRHPKLVLFKVPMPSPCERSTDSQRTWTIMRESTERATRRWLASSPVNDHDWRRAIVHPRVPSSTSPVDFWRCCKDYEFGQQVSHLGNALCDCFSFATATFSAELRAGSDRVAGNALRRRPGFHGTAWSLTAWQPLAEDNRHHRQ